MRRGPSHRPTPQRATCKSCPAAIRKIDCRQPARDSQPAAAVADSSAGNVRLISDLYTSGVLCVMLIACSPKGDLLAIACTPDLVLRYAGGVK